MPVKIFSYAGQSNIVGRWSPIDFIPSFGLDRAIPLVRQGAVSDLGPLFRPDPDGTRGNREEGFVPEGLASFGYSVEIFLSRIFDSPEQRVVALKTANGGTTLPIHWNPELPGSAWREFTLGMEVAHAEARARSDEVSVGPLIWWHGESDSTNPQYAAAYARNLRNFVAEYRDLVGDPEARIVIVLTVTGGGGERRRQVQDAQRQLAAEDPDILLYDPSHLARYPGDDVHFGRDYAIEAATDMAEMFIDAGWESTANRWGSAGADEVTGDAAAQVLWGLAGDDTLRGLGGDDTLAGDLGADLIDGGAGTDTAVYDAAIAGVAVDLAAGRGRDGIAEGDRLIRVENLQGGAYADTLTGDEGANRLEGGGGDDRLAGGPGADSLLGGDGSDTLSGGAGEDSLAGGEGGDLLTGGPGADRLVGRAGDDTLAGGPGDDLLAGGSGDDTYRVGAGDAIAESRGAAGGTDIVESPVDWTLAAGLEILVLTGTKPVSGSGNAAANLLTGNAGANALRGLDGADRLDGGAGNDTLSGGAAADTLIGGTGADIFRFDRVSQSVPDAPDLLLGFERAGLDGGDRVDLSGIDADATRPGNQAFDFGATAVGSLHLFDLGADTLVRGNVDPKPGFEFAILIRDGAVRASDYGSGDFIL